jgi:hypothetical protein|nr:hypothetical protein [Neorhizobium tomejilense]
MKLSTLLAAAFVAGLSASSASAQGFDPDADVFDHNGSMIVAQYKYGNLRYMTVKPSLQGLVDTGMAAFSGQIERRGKVFGTAYVFKKGCPFVPYEVKGQYDPKIPGYVMTGKYPVRSKKGCEVVGWSDKGANARLVFVDITELERRDVEAAGKARKAEQDAYIEQVYETESDPNWFDGFISSEELMARQKKGK